MRFWILAAPLMLLAACSGSGEANGNAASDTAAAPVAAVKPPEGKQWRDVVSATDLGMRMGNPDAPIKLIEYGSRMCPTCRKFEQDGFDPLISNYVNSGKVSFEFRDYLVHGALDLPTTILGECVSGDAFFPILEQMFQAQPEFADKFTNMSEAEKNSIQSMDSNAIALMLAQKMDVIDFMQKRGMTAEKARACLADKGTIQKLADRMGEAAKMGVSGTPSFFLNGKQVEDAVTWDQLEPKLKAAGA
ncbi:DsbA family protein [Stakelama pacifica]|uniref:Protein-disulfide isomerase n=1 Tax=Stakelama pacifica TaxID=517720 RepID=A0A4V3BU39_9SPHN|nr:thioredoxin domain-containing protein [Stakelama pacifica]TDN85678.1 protein-disulfide isomerase [Stakelama pacifica]GGO91953.1 disulfide bond formation protein DsbD [Stakelama pacifica]